MAPNGTSHVGGRWTADESTSMSGGSMQPKLTLLALAQCVALPYSLDVRQHYDCYLGKVGRKITTSKAQSYCSFKLIYARL